MNVFLWHVHGSWTTAFVQGRHRYLLPVVPERGLEGRGRADTWDWPSSAVELDRALATDAPVDVLIVQRPEELDLAMEWLGGRRPGRDVAVLYLEHNAPREHAATTRHPAADRDDLVVVHVTHFNDLFWDCGTTRTVVIEHGIVDPGYRFSGELPRVAAVINEPVRRARVAGTDLLEPLSRAVSLDLFGMGSAPLGGVDDLVQDKLHDELARRRAYVHPFRWTSLGLTLIEAMHLGMPVVAVAATDVVEAVPPGTGVISTDIERLGDAIAEFAHDVDTARATGRRARAYALRRYGLGRFLSDWDALLEEVAA